MWLELLARICNKHGQQQITAIDNTAKDTGK